jgi:hypothetical protein
VVACLIRLVLAASGDALASAWCELPFKAVAAGAPLLVHARVEPEGRAGVRLVVLDVLHGSADRATLRLASADLERYELRRGDHVVMALTERWQIFQGSGPLGACQPVSVLPLRGGRLRPRDRPSYDSGDGPLSMEQVLEELVPAGAPD